MKAAVDRTGRPEVVGGLGGFAGLFALELAPRTAARCSRPRPTASAPRSRSPRRWTGTTRSASTWSAMVVDDLVVCGAEPLFMTDYIACGRVVPERIAAIVARHRRGLRAGRLRAGRRRDRRAPGLLEPDEYDLAGAGIGVVEADALLGAGPGPGRRRARRDGSSGLHSNGYSLVRTCWSAGRCWRSTRAPELGRTLGEELLEPTRIYAQDCLALAAATEVHAFAHVTGGGLAGNLARVLPPTVDAVVDRATWTPPPIFDLVARLGRSRRPSWSARSTSASAWSPCVPDGAGRACRLLADARRAGLGGRRGRARHRSAAVGTHSGWPVARSGPGGGTLSGVSGARRTSRRRRSYSSSSSASSSRRRRTRGRLASSSRCKAVEVGAVRAVLQLAGDLRLLGLGTAAPHGSTPSTGQRGDLHEAAPQCGHRRSTRLQLTGHSYHVASPAPRPRRDAGHPDSGSTAARPPQPPRLLAGRSLAGEASAPIRPGTRIPRSRPTSAIRRSASRSAATAGGTPSSAARREDAAGGVEDRRRPWRAARSKSKPVQLVGDLDHPAGVHARSPARRGRRGRPAASPPRGGPAGCWRRRRRPGRCSTSTTVVGRARRRARTARRRPGRRGPAPRRRRPSDLRVRGARPRSTAAADTSVTTTSAPSSSRCSTRCRPTLPTPAMPTRRPASEAVPHRRSAHGPHALEDAEGGEHRRVAGAALGRGAPGDEPATPARRRPCPRRRCRRRRR